jgi:hypothetical protein
VNGTVTPPPNPGNGGIHRRTPVRILSAQITGSASSIPLEVTARRDGTAEPTLALSNGPHEEVMTTPDQIRSLVEWMDSEGL